MKKWPFFLILSFLLYTRLIGLDWGLPYPMHPDERNMAVAIQGLSCNFSSFRVQLSWIKACFNPRFFAYGQFPLYLGYLLVKTFHVFKGALGQSISFVEATMALRIISAVASIINAYIIVEIAKNIIAKKKWSFAFQAISFILVIFSPYFIQLAHFGTTESLLMLFYSSITLLCLRLKKNAINQRIPILLGLVTGFSIATKVSSFIFAPLPLVVMLFINMEKRRGYRRTIFLYLSQALLFIIAALVVAVLFSPHNIFSMKEFIDSLRYESAVGTGAAKVFYTRTFEYTLPLVFQLRRIFPYALGFPQFIIGFLGFFLLSWKNYKINILRLAILIYFLPSAYIFAKWSRFMAPIFPLISIFAVFGTIEIYKILHKRASKTAVYIVVGLLIVFLAIPGLSYLSIYRSDDVRLQASEWMLERLPSGSSILSETANVVDVPLQGTFGFINKINTISFNFYNVDVSAKLQKDLEAYIKSVDYILIPSRRVFANHTCLIPSDVGSSTEAQLYGFEKVRCDRLLRKYPVLNNYYSRLFSGELGFEEIKIFESYPRINILGYDIVSFPDEGAEETWTVFDHPVIRLYKRKIPKV